MLLTLTSRRAKRRAKTTAKAAAAPDRSIAVIVFMMALVFIPVLGMHVAVSALHPESAAATGAALQEGISALASMVPRSPG
ncbi:hypothetical protein [Methylobacterium nigriterrae]|uniref:hypothetical protein n=1 Tax=Methylobacterium nigriterrae TaxID=3127512 RepID=UPI003013F86D